MIRTIKKIIVTILLPALLVACENKELCYDHPHGQFVKVEINWENGVAKPRQGMRTNLFSVTEARDFGIKDMTANGDTIQLYPGTSYMSLCYDYYGSQNVYFRNENDVDKAEAYCASLVRASYTRAFPDENTVAEPGIFYVDRVNRFDVTQSKEVQVLNFYPKNVLKTYTFRVKEIKGAEHITATRAALSGMSASYFLTTGDLAAQPSTVLFNATVDIDNGWIVGSFRAFGRLDATNSFTIEILYPSATGDIVSQSWDVTDQMVKVGQIDSEFDIEIDTDILIIPSEPGNNSMFDATVSEWDNEVIPIKM